MPVVSYNSVGGYSTGLTMTAVIDATGNITGVSGSFTGNFSGATGSFSKLLTASAGISAAGSTFSSTTNTLDVIASTDGAGLRIAKATTGTNSRIGGIRLGRAGTTALNTYLEGSSGTFTIYNGVDTTGSKIVDFAATVTGFSGDVTATGLISASRGISASGATFSGDIAVNGGDITTTSANATVFDTTATTLSIGSAATSWTVGATSGTATIRNPQVVLGNSSTTTISTPESTTNNLYISPFGNLALSPSSLNASEGTVTVVTITNAVDGLGTVKIDGGDLYLGVKSLDGFSSVPVDIIFEGATDNTNETTLTVVDPTADRTITLPDASGTVALTSSTVASFNGTTGAVTGVSRVNGLSGGITFAAGTGITFTTSGNTITVASAPNSTTQTLDFSENINGLEIVFSGTGDSLATSLRYVENNKTITATIDSGGDFYSCVLDSIQSFYDPTNGWSARLVAKAPFMLAELSHTAEQMIANGINGVNLSLTSFADVTTSDSWVTTDSVNIYHQEETYVTKTVTGQTWVTANSYIECKVLGLTTADHTPEDAILEGVKFEINNIVAGTGFDIIGHAPEGTYGKYTVKCLGQ